MAAKSDEFSPQRKRVKNNEISSSYSSSKRYAEASTVTKRKREFEEEDDKDDQIFEPQRAKQVKVTNVVSPVEKGDPEGRLKTTENDTTNNARNEPVEDDLSEEYLKPIERKEFVVTEPEHYPTVEERKRDENKAHGRLKGLLGAISKSDSPAKEDVKHVPAGPSLTIVEPVKLIPQPTVTTTVTITSTVELFKPIQVSGGPVTVALTSTINLATTVEPKLVFAGATSVTASTAIPSTTFSLPPVVPSSTVPSSVQPPSSSFAMPGLMLPSSAPSVSAPSVPKAPTAFTVPNFAFTAPTSSPLSLATPISAPVSSFATPSTSSSLFPSSNVVPPKQASVSFTAPSFSLPTSAQSVPSFSLSASTQSAPSFSLPASTQSVPSFSLPASTQPAPSFALPNSTQTVPTVAQTSQAFTVPNFAFTLPTSSTAGLPASTASSNLFGVPAALSSSDKPVVPPMNLAPKSVSFGPIAVHNFATSLPPNGIQAPLVDGAPNLFSFGAGSSPARRPPTAARRRGRR